MAAESRTYTGIDRSKMERLHATIAPYVKLPDADCGSIESQGVKGGYVYDAAAQTLVLTIDDVPFFVPKAVIWSTIERAMES